MQSTYKPSQFNCTTLNENRELLIYNTLTCNLYKTLPQNAKIIREVLNRTEINLDDIPYPSLINKGYLVPISTDELAVFQSKLDAYYNSPELEVMILPTHQCNCRCVYCYEDFSSGIMSDKVQENLIKYVRKRLKNCTALHISWFGGEPLIAMDVIRNLSERFIEICKAEHKRYTASITTNGTLLTPDLFRELQKYRVLSYQITVDGTREVHDVQRPLISNGSSYDLITSNLVGIKREIKGNHFIILLRINVTKKILDQLENYICQMDNMFGNDPRFYLIFNVANDWGGERVNNFRDYILSDNDSDTFNRIRSLISSMKTSLNIQGLGGSLNEEIGFTPGCYVNKRNFITIDSTGLINKCAQETRNRYPDLGDLSEDHFKFDDNEEAKWSSLNTFLIPDKCKNCFLLPIGCYRTYCTLQRYQEKYCDKNFIEEPKCPYTKYDFNSLLCIHDKKSILEYIEKTNI